MKLGGYLQVRNERRVIRQVIEYHLNVQKFDFLLILDDGSHDGTAEFLASLKDPRVRLMAAPKGVGFQQDTLSKPLAKYLMEKAKCDWVLPIDADEFWVSRNHGCVRKALKLIEGQTDLLYTRAYHMFPTSLPEYNRTGFFMRDQVHASLPAQTKVALHGKAFPYKGYAFGNHDLESCEAAERARKLELPPEELCRFHYHVIDEDYYRQKVLTQVEGFLMRAGDEWLQQGRRSGRKLVGYHHRKWYEYLRNGSFSERFQRQYVLNEAKLQRRMEKGNLFVVEDMTHLLPANFPESPPAVKALFEE